MSVLDKKINARDLVAELVQECIELGRDESRERLAAAEARAERYRKALEELVACKKLKDELDALDKPAPVDMSYAEKLKRSQRRRVLWAEYEHRKPLAWDAARAALRGEG